MATVSLTCFNCRQVSQGYPGTVVECPFCRQHLQVPGQPSQPVPPAFQAPGYPPPSTPPPGYPPPSTPPPGYPPPFDPAPGYPPPSNPPPGYPPPTNPPPGYPQPPNPPPADWEGYATPSTTPPAFSAPGLEPPRYPVPSAPPPSYVAMSDPTPLWQPGNPPAGIQEVSVAPPPPVHVSSVKKRALLVGINYFRTKAELKGCINDVHTMREFLLTHGFLPQDMVILTDDQQHPDGQPTNRNILKAMKWLTSGVELGDILFFHYSGHGSQQRDRTGMEEDGMDETICPVDYLRGGQITDDQIFMLLAHPLPPGVRLTAVMDCCHSGTGMDLPFTWELGADWVEDRNPFHSRGDVQLFSGCEDEQTSADVQARRGKAASGAMTAAFIQTLKENPRPTYPQLMETLHHHLRRGRFTQKPVLSASQRFNLNRYFGLDDVTPNTNRVIGRPQRKFKATRRHLGEMEDVLRIY